MRTDYLFAMPSFLTGVARLFDLYGQFDTYNDSSSDDSADARALYSDWRMVGQDLAGAMTRMDRELSTAEPPDTAASGEAGRRR
jgi:hypothetical protein